MNLEQLSRVAYQPTETGMSCRCTGHGPDCFCDITPSPRPTKTVPLWELPFGEAIAELTGYPDGPHELADFLCMSLGLWEEQKRLEREQPRLMRALGYLEKAYHSPEYDEPKPPKVKADGTADRRNTNRVSTNDRCKAITEALAAGLTLEEVCTLLNLTPKQAVDILAFRRGKVVEPRTLRTIAPDDLIEFDMDCRLAILNMGQIARKWSVNRIVVERWVKRCGLSDLYTKYQHNGQEQGQNRYDARSGASGQFVRAAPI